MTWTSYNYPSGISSSGESTVFQYGPNRDRWQTVYTGSIGTETTYHVGPLLEKVINGGTTDFRHYIFAGSEAVAIYSRTSTGTNTLHYLLADHLGSFASILTSTGTSVVNESFTAYGNRRSAATWSGAPLSADETAINGVSREGFTGQTVLGVSMGLNHMNGRVEDAITGRFLSPDPHGIEPANTQSFNRYSYVQNRPLTLTDPTGFTTTSGNYKDYTNIPAGFGFLSSRIQQRMFNGVVSSEGTFYNASSGNGAFNNMMASDDTFGGVAPGLYVEAGVSVTSGPSPSEGGSSNASPSADAANQAAAAGDSSAQSPTSAGSTIYDPNDITKGIAVTGHYMDAPSSQTSTGFDYGPIFASPQFTGYAPAMNFVGKAFLVEMGVIGVAAGAGTAAPVIKGAASAIGAVGADALSTIAPLFRGAALGYSMELGSSFITGITHLTEDGEIAEFTLEQLQGELKAIELENPEVAGPELPWGQH